MKTITFINEKGGVGKTAICFNLAWHLSKTKKILLIDLDGQRANLTYFTGIKKTDELLTMYDVLKGITPISSAIQGIRRYIDIVPAAVTTSFIDTDIEVKDMKRAIDEVKDRYDYIFIDVSPSPNWSQFLALSVSDYCIIPMLPDVTSLEADEGMIETIEEVHKQNTDLKVLGLLINRNENRTNLSRQVKETAQVIAKRLNTEIFDTKIRNSVAVSEAVYFHVGITEYAKKLAVAEDYRQLAKEIERRIRRDERPAVTKDCKQLAREIREIERRIKEDGKK